MNTLFLPNLPGTSTQITGSPTTFNQATFYPCSGFTAQSVPIFSTGKIYLGVATGQLPISIPASGSYTITANSVEAGEGVLNNYFVSPQFTGDGICIIYA